MLESQSCFGWLSSDRFHLPESDLYSISLQISASVPRIACFQAKRAFQSYSFHSYSFRSYSFHSYSFHSTHSIPHTPSIHIISYSFHFHWFNMTTPSSPTDSFPYIVSGDEDTATSSTTTEIPHPTWVRSFFAECNNVGHRTNLLDSEKTHWKCLHTSSCTSILAKDKTSKDNISSRRNHLLRVHNLTHQQAARDQPLITTAMSKYSGFEAAGFEKVLSRFIVMSDQPFTLIEEESFQDVVNYAAQKDLRYSCAKTMKTRVHELYSLWRSGQGEISLGDPSRVFS